MRFKIEFSKNTTPVPINNQSLLNSYIHKCLGEKNKWHDSEGIYSISSIQGGKLNRDTNTLEFNDGSYFIVSSFDMDFLNTLSMGILNNQNFTNGMSWAGTTPIKESFLNGWNHFATLSPFMIKNYDENKKYDFLTIKDEGFEEKVKNYLINKIKKFKDVDLTEFDVKIPEHDGHKTKKIMVKNVINKANQCHISINCSKEIAEFLYTIGIGNSCGSGFGAVYKTENKNLYKNRN
jgi:CRISPR-associated endoribonuclease Cas6